MTLLKSLILFNTHKPNRGNPYGESKKANTVPNTAVCNEYILPFTPNGHPNKYCEYPTKEAMNIMLDNKLSIPAHRSIINVDTAIIIERINVNGNIKTLKNSRIIFISNLRICFICLSEIKYSALI